MLQVPRQPCRADAYSENWIQKSFTVQRRLAGFKKKFRRDADAASCRGAIWSAPTLDLETRARSDAGTGNRYTDVPTGHSDAIVAFDIATGKIKWVNLISPKDNFPGLPATGGGGQLP